MPPPPIDPATRIGHVHLKGADRERAIAYYCGLLEFELTLGYRRHVAFDSASETESRLSSSLSSRQKRPRFRAFPSGQQSFNLLS